MFLIKIAQLTHVQFFSIPFTNPRKPLKKHLQNSLVYNINQFMFVLQIKTDEIFYHPFYLSCYLNCP